MKIGNTYIIKDSINYAVKDINSSRA